MPQLTFGSSMIMLGDAKSDEYGQMVGTSGEAGGKSTYVAVDDTDTLYALPRRRAPKSWRSRPTATTAAATSSTPPEGNIWSFGTYWPKADDPAG